MRPPAERFQRARQRMDIVRRQLEAALAALEPSLLSQPPAPGRWSVADVFEHLQLVEVRVLERMERALQNGVPPRRDPRRFFHLPVSWVEWRIPRVRTFPPFEPRRALPAEQVLAEWRRARARLCELLARYRHCDLRGLCARHPILGYLDGYQWMAFLAAHKRRHWKQIAEIVATLRLARPRPPASD